MSKLIKGGTSWTTTYDLDISRVTPGATRFGSQGILVFGGYHGNEPTDEALLYDYSLGDSQDADQMGEPRYDFAYASDSVGRAYAIGGFGEEPGDLLSSVERYSPVGDSWEEMASLPVALSGACAVGVGGNEIHVLGGETASGIQGAVYVYDISSDSWSAGVPLPTPVRDSATVLFENRIYVLGGLSSSGAVDTVQILDLATGLWLPDDVIPAARSGHAAVVTGEGKILVAGGFDATGTASASVFQTQQLDLPETTPVFTTNPVLNGSLDRPYSYDSGAVGNPPPSFSLVAAPAGMSINPNDGVISWQPETGQVGVNSVTVRASNRVGDVDQTFEIAVVNDTYPPTAPTAVTVVEVGATFVELSWSGATDAVGVDHYGLYRQYRCGWRGRNRCYSLIKGNIVGTSTIVEGLDPLSYHTYAIRAFDADGNVSPNSPLVSFQTLSAPVSFRYSGVTTLPANFPLDLKFHVNANPVATYSIVSGPADLTLDSETGVASWTPSAADVGIHTLVVRATNSGGSADLTVEITVNPDAPQLSASISTGSAVSGVAWAGQIFDGSHTLSTYELISAPPGMTLDTNTGQLNWVPTPDDAGTCRVTVRGTNAAASADITFEFYCHFTGEVANIQVTGLTDLHPTASWTAPVGAGADRVSGYTIVARARYRWGRAWRTHTMSYETDAETPTVLLEGLLAGKTYALYVNAFDENDNRGLTGISDTTFAPVPGLPNVGWTVGNVVTGAGSSGLVAGQELVLQFSSPTTEFGTVSYSTVNVPAGFTLNETTGEGRWTPGAANIGQVTITVRATNLIGPRDVSVTLYVKFSGPVRNAYATKSGTSAFASWQAPLDNVVPIASYRVTKHWRWSSRSRSSSLSATGTSLNFGLYPTGAVWHKGVTIVPIDAEGRAGVATPLIPYNGSAEPANLPPEETAWVEQVTFDSVGTPLVEIRGQIGVAAGLEVSKDLVTWDPVDDFSIDDQGVVVCPDAESQSSTQCFYRLAIPAQ